MNGLTTSTGEEDIPLTPSARSTLEEGLGLGESAWDQGKDGRVLSLMGRERVELLVKGIAGQVSSGGWIRSRIEDAWGKVG